MDQLDAPLLLVKGATCIPDDAIDLERGLFIISRFATARRRGIDSTWNYFRKEIHWTDRREDVRNFVLSCLLYRLSKSWNKTPRALSTTVHASNPNQVLNFDFPLTGQTDEDETYIIVLKDRLNGLLLDGAFGTCPLETHG